MLLCIATAAYADLWPEAVWDRVDRKRTKPDARDRTPTETRNRADRKSAAALMAETPPPFASEEDRVFYAEVGTTIRRRRLEIGLTLDEVSTAVGVSKPMMHKYEMGWKLSADSLVKIALALDIMPSELLGTPDPYEQPELRRLLSAWGRLPTAASRAAIIALVDDLSIDRS